MDERHGGEAAVEVARAHGAQTMFTLSGAHVFPLYDAAIGGGAAAEREQPPPMRLLDVRHEQTAVFAAEATGKLTHTPGLVVVTAGPGVTNAISGLVQAHRSGVPLVMVGGRAPTEHWGWGSLQELDHPALVRTVTKLARTVADVDDIPAAISEAFTVAGTAHRGPVFVDIPMDQLYRRSSTATTPIRRPEAEAGTSDAGRPDPEVLAEIATMVSIASRPLLVLGSDVWLGGAEVAAVELVESLEIPVVTNGMARGILPPGHRLSVGRARSVAVGECDLAIVIGAPLDFRLAYGNFGGAERGYSGGAERGHSGGAERGHSGGAERGHSGGAERGYSGGAERGSASGETENGGPAPVIHLVDAPDQLASHVQPVLSSATDLAVTLPALRAAWEQVLRRPDRSAWCDRLRAVDRQNRDTDRAILQASTTPIHPARILGELMPLLADDAVVIGDGGDFVSFAGRHVEPGRPGCWLDPGPYGCLGAGLGAAIAARIERPSAQVVLLLGDGAAGMSLLDVDTLVRHRLPVVMIVGNNGCWGLERQSMRMLYGYDVAAELATATAYDAVVGALGGAGETVTDPAALGPALRRAFAADAPYLVNVICDPEIGYPRRTFGV